MSRQGTGGKKSDLESGKSESSILGHLRDTLCVNMAHFIVVGGKKGQCSQTIQCFFGVDFSTEIQKYVNYWRYKEPRRTNKTPQ